MKRLICCLFFPLLLLLSDLQAYNGEDLVIHNRILATVNGKAISVFDVMKKMDVFLARAYPQHATSPFARHQFFSQHWRDTLNQMIDNELIIADAEKLEIKIADAEIRQKIHERFGPNVMTKLDQLGITLDEAWYMIYSEMAVQRMMWYRVHSKAIGRAGPQDIKNAYDAYIVVNPPKEQWKYQVLSIRGATEALGKVFAQKTHTLIRNHPLPLESLAQELRRDLDDMGVQVTLSDEYDIEQDQISDAHKSVLCKLKPGEVSDLITQVSRRKKGIVHRIFHLKEHKVTPPKSFDMMVDTLHDQLVNEEINKEFPLYLDKLRQQFNFDEKELASLDAFVPFELNAP